MTISIQAALARATTQLGAMHPASDTAALDAQVLLCAVLDCNRAFLIAHGEDPLAQSQSRALAAAVQRREQGEPVAYILGQREFWSLTLDVTPATLIPRPDTETLVQAALDCLQGMTEPRILDLGTGTGAIALALASERGDATVVATDCEASTLAVAKGNGARLAPGRVDWHLGDWFNAVAELDPFGVIVSNPPYIAADDPHLAAGDVRFEPKAALCASDQGMADLIHIIDGAPAHLRAGGWLLVEHGYDQGAAVQRQFLAAGYRDVRLVNDLAGQPRVTLGRFG